MKRKHYLEYIRIISCILVVFVHVSALFFDTTHVRSFEWNIINLYDCAGIVGVPLFVMISGALHLDSGHFLNGKKLLSKTLRLVVIFYLWTLVGNVLYMWNLNQPVTLSLVKNEVLIRTIKGYYMSHLWFLPMLITLYIITPLIRQLVKERNVARYLLILLFVLDIAIPTLLKFSFPYKWVLEELYQFHAFTLATGYLFYYVLGHYIDTYFADISPSRFKALTFLGILCFVIQVAVCSVDAWIRNVPAGIFNEPFAITMVPVCICIFLVAKKNTAKRIPGRILTLISSLSFGIYLFHPFAIQLLEHSGIADTDIPFLLRIPLLVLLCLIICIPVNYLIGKLPKLNRYIQ